MHTGVIVLIILVVLLVCLVAAFLYRLVILRRGGTAAIMRTAPAAGGSGWRHGVIRYGDNSLVFFKLSSLRPGPDHRITRQGVDLGERRRPRSDEFDIMSEDIAILELTDGGREYEIALDRGALTAFLSWLESRPSGRSKRGRPAA
ncbi:MAG: DUF2550 domain-containing protein [Rhodococcus sp. (in: high G+C Gram-positive bacteria)]|jgi:hypothetical protein|uniref:DUF2550 domain-containing protein n=1 Tax=Rhodococcoides yunnanense TaxID=278209 RepID=UPI0022B11169|nr:DUF2550 domain-containing protein [Rhodococcus yunnanensis]MCZ4277148.1 DUF2550 domain-containing protein [Rhodococcus yunnanensis]